MPKKSKKSEIEKDVYIPLSEEDVKHALEIPVKHIKIENIEKVEKVGEKASERILKGVKKEGKIKANVKKERKTAKTIKKSVQKIKLQNNKIEFETTPTNNKITGKEYTLIITEKPQAALKIASALSSGKMEKFSENQVPYYELERGGEKIVVACAVGHLFTLTSRDKGWPVFDIGWVENSLVKKQDWSKKYYNLLKKLVKNAKEFIVATDFDTEGEVIGWNVIRFIARQKDAKRMKFSSLTKNELEQAYEHTLPTIEWGQAIAGETRHFLDWMYGINLSRALMSAIKTTGRFRIMSIGRVQGPALKLVVDKELEIQKFKPEPYWQVFIKLKDHNVELRYEKDIFKKEEIEKFKKLEGLEGNATTEKKSRNLAPQAPFDLTSLQREAYRLFKISPTRTLQIAQSLYLAGLISYPRTSSQKIPDSINPQGILQRLSKRFKETKFATRAKPFEGNKSDPAHPSIYPTGEFQELGGEEEKIYSLIVKRFIACFCEDAIIEDKKVLFITEKDKFRFSARGLEIVEKGWMNVYPTAIQEAEIETIEGKKTIEKSRIEEKETQPPRRYTPASLITELEKRNLGTKATRSVIVDTLYSRNYIKDTSIQATPLGISLIKTLEKHSPIIIDEALTRKFEKEMDSIQTAKKNLEAKEQKIINEAKETILKIAENIKKEEVEIGKELLQANLENYEQEKKNSALFLCPNCKKNNLRILVNKASKRQFVACSGYPDCKTTFSLPPNGLIKKTDKTCEECGWPKLISMRKGKPPWFFCFNPACPSRKKRNGAGSGGIDYEKNLESTKLVTKPEKEIELERTDELSDEE